MKWNGLPFSGRVIAALCALTVIVLSAASTAHAGVWIQVACVNPNGTAAPSEGWWDGFGGPADPDALASPHCAPGSPMTAMLTAGQAAPPDSDAYLAYTPPAGAELIGGTVNVTMSAYGYGRNSAGTLEAEAYARLYTPNLSNSGGNVFKQCEFYYVACGPPASNLDFSGTVTLPSDQGGHFYAEAACLASDGVTPCTLNAHHGVWSNVAISWARMLLSSNVSPQGSGFSGTVLDPSVRGTAHILFTASEPSGPGIYSVSVAIDGHTVSQSAPNSNGGECVPVGTDAATGALMFDHQQPCLTDEAVAAPVPTRGLPDGRHELTVSIADAAGNTSTVFDRTITTSNPQRTPVPRGRRFVRARFVISWHWQDAVTRLRAITVSRLPRRARLTVTCPRGRCPGAARTPAAGRRISALLHALRGWRLRAGDRIRLTVSAPGHTPERIELQIRRGQVPLARLL